MASKAGVSSRVERGGLAALRTAPMSRRRLASDSS